MSIDRVLDALEVGMEPFALCELHGECTLGLGRRPFAVLHYVLAGSGRMTVGELPAFDAGPGTVLLAPAFQPHWLHASGARGHPLPSCRPLELGLDHLVIGDDRSDRALVAICGRIDIAYRGMRGALSLLKAPIAEQLPPGDRVRIALDELVYELANPTVGTRALARSLMAQCVILLLRRRHRAGDPSLKWMVAAADETLWGALQAMLDRPGDPHSVESLADACSMSRAAFAGRFSDVYGSGPMELLRIVRLNRAAELLVRSDVPVKRVAEITGYASRTYFTRAFEAQFGLPPGQFRAAAHRDVAVPS